MGSFANNLRRIRDALLSSAAFVSILCGGLAAAERLELEVREVGGIRRHEPLNALITLNKPVPRDTPFRLLLDGMPVIAQFRPAGGDGPAARWWIDFSTMRRPLRAGHVYVVEYGSDVRPVAESTKGHVLRQHPDEFVIENEPYITWKVPRDLAGLLRSVNFPPNEHLRPNSPGLVLRDRADGRHVLGGAGVKATVLRSGNRAVALRFTGGFDQGPLAAVQWTTDLIFPSPVSWVEVVCTVDDRDGKVAGLGAELNLALDPPKPDAPTLVDIGAWTQIYASLTQNEIVELRADAMPGNTTPPTATTKSDPKKTDIVRAAVGRCRGFRGTPDKLRLVAANFAGTAGDGRHSRRSARCRGLAARHGSQSLPGVGRRSLRARRQRTPDGSGRRCSERVARLRCRRRSHENPAAKNAALLAALRPLPATVQRGHKSADDANPARGAAEAALVNTDKMHKYRVHNGSRALVHFSSVARRYPRRDQTLRCGVACLPGLSPSRHRLASSATIATATCFSRKALRRRATLASANSYAHECAGNAGVMRGDCAGYVWRMHSDCFKYVPIALRMRLFRVFRP